MTAQARDIIMWVGAEAYKTWRAFADEAARMGVCKRVKSRPNGITLGQSKCYLIHGERISTMTEIAEHSFVGKKGEKLTQCRYCSANDFQNVFCISRKVRRVGKPRRTIMGYFVIEHLWIPDETLADVTEDRLCGRPKVGGIYLCGPLTELAEPIPWPGDTFVGYRYYQAAT
jgi:hypothetical protein